MPILCWNCNRPVLACLQPSVQAQAVRCEHCGRRNRIVLKLVAERMDE